MATIKSTIIFSFLVSCFLFLVTPISAASFKISPSSGKFNQNCTSSVDVILDAESGSTNAADIIIDYDPSQIEVLQMKNGTVYTDYFGNVVDATNGVIRLTGASFTGTVTGSGVFATIEFKPLTSSGTASFNIRFTGAHPYNTLDSNIADSATSNDLLSSIQNGTFTIDSGSCVDDTTPPSITFQSPVNNQQNVPADANIQVTITDDGSGVNIGTVEIIINGVVYNSTSSRVTVTGNNANYQITVDPIDSLYTSQSNTILVKATDFSGNYRQDSISFNIPVPTSTPIPTSIPTSTPSLSSTLGPSPIPSSGPTPTSFVCYPAPPIFTPYPDTNSPTIDFIDPQEKGKISSTPELTIRVSDTGSGIDPNTIKVTFDSLIFTDNDPQLSYSGESQSYLIKVKLDRSFEPDSSHKITAFISDISGNGISKSINVQTESTLTEQVLAFFYPTSTKRLSPLRFIPLIIIFILLIFLFHLFRPYFYFDNRIPLGYVYNSHTREPIADIKVDIFDKSNRRIKTVITNTFGIFSAHIPLNKYKFIPRSHSFSFPSITQNRLNHPHPYFGQITDNYQAIPVDPISSPGFSFLPRPGLITNNQNQPVAGLTLGLIDIKFNSLIATRITDEQGRYRFLVPHGHYQLVNIDHQGQVLATIDTRHRLTGYTTVNQNFQI